MVGSEWLKRRTLDVLHVARLVVVIGLITTSINNMTIENKFLCPKSANFDDP